MNIKFTEVVIQNKNGIEVEVELEVPIGSTIAKEKISNDKTKSFVVDKNDIQSAKITIKAQGHEDYPDKMTYDFSNSGSPYRIYIEKINAFTNIGAIHGEVTARF